MIEKKFLKRGDLKRIEKVTGYSSNYVSRVANGADKNALIEAALKELENTRKAEIIQAQAELSTRKKFTVPQFLTSDPADKRGQTGIITGFDKNRNAIMVRFDDGVEALYDADLLNNQDEI
ncbi:MAG: hypothetical protein WBP45_09665 [Daejeonella sp.]